MIKKIIFFSVIISQLTISCSNNDEPANLPEESLSEQIANITKQPYSKLTPSEQKVKLEAEANDMLVQMDKSKTSGAIEAIQNLGNLLSINSVDIFNGKNDNQIEDILNVSGVYGIYTWNNSKQIWIKTTSTTELQFIFPAIGLSGFSRAGAGHSVARADRFYQRGVSPDIHGGHRPAHLGAILRPALRQPRRGG